VIYPKYKDSLESKKETYKKTTTINRTFN